MKELYLIQSDLGYYKIGISVSASKRIKELQTGSSHKLILIQSIRFKSEYIFKIEAALHRQLAQYKTMSQHEWFDIDSLWVESNFSSWANSIYQNLLLLNQPNPY